MIVMALILVDPHLKFGGALIRFYTGFTLLFTICSFVSSGMLQREQRWAKWEINNG
jgi:hypothetical protein